jgi:hypothetical protein
MPSCCPSGRLTALAAIALLSLAACGGQGRAVAVGDGAADGTTAARGTGAEDAGGDGPVSRAEIDGSDTSLAATVDAGGREDAPATSGDAAAADSRAADASADTEAPADRFVADTGDAAPPADLFPDAVIDGSSDQAPLDGPSSDVAALPPPPDAGAPDRMADTVPPPPGCHDLVNSAPAPLLFLYSSAAAPTPMGGRVSSGIYHYVSSTYHGASLACPRIAPGLVDVRYTLRITAATLQTGTGDVVASVNGQTEVRQSFGYSTAGITFMSSTICGQPATSTVEYTATDTELILFQSDPVCGRQVALLRKP